MRRGRLTPTQSLGLHRMLGFSGNALTANAKRGAAVAAAIDALMP
jgi:hypothetical protein